jgi:hypothetical protein
MPMKCDVSHNMNYFEYSPFISKMLVYSFMCCFLLTAKLGQFSNSTSISSDMMYGNDEGRQERDRSGSGENFDALKASVKDFFSDVQARF